MNVADGVYKLVELWGAERRRRDDGGLGYRQSCLASLEASSGRGQSMLPHGVSDLADAFLMVDAALMGANPLVAEVVKARYVHRFTLEQIAKRVSVSVSLATVKRRLHDGLVAVQEASMLYRESEKFHQVKKAA